MIASNFPPLLLRVDFIDEKALENSSNSSLSTKRAFPPHAKALASVQIKDTGREYLNNFLQLSLVQSLEKSISSKHKTGKDSNQEEYPKHRELKGD